MTDSHFPHGGRGGTVASVDVYSNFRYAGGAYVSVELYLIYGPMMARVNNTTHRTSPFLSTRGKIQTSSKFVLPAPVWWRRLCGIFINGGGPSRQEKRDGGSVSTTRGGRKLPPHIHREVGWGWKGIYINISLWDIFS